MNLNSDGTVASHQKISDTEGGFTGTLHNNDFFGFSVTSAGDLDRDGAADLVVGAVLDDDGGSTRGAVWVLFLNSNGTVASHQKISDAEGGFTGTLHDFDQFGWSVTSPGDLDGNGVSDLVASAPGEAPHGAVWILFLNGNGTQIEAPIDIKFCNNPNTFNCKKKGSLPVTIFGTADLDVSQINLSTVQLCLANDTEECVSLIDAAFPEDRGNPDTDLGVAQCGRRVNRDGFDDLEVLFSGSEVAPLIEWSTIGAGNASPTLIIKGELTDGTPFQSTPVDDIGIDQLLIVNK